MNFSSWLGDLSSLQREDLQIWENDAGVRSYTGEKLVHISGIAKLKKNNFLIMEVIVNGTRQPIF